MSGRFAHLLTGVVRWLFLLLSAGTCFSEIPAPPLLVEKERVVEASRPPNKSWEMAEAGRKLIIREVVATRDESRATIQLTESRQLRLRANSQVRVLPSMVDGNPMGLELRKGEIYLHSREAGPGIQIETPAGMGKSNGTQFRVRVDDDGSTTFTVFEGGIEMSNLQGALQLGKNEEGVMERGKAPRRTARIVTKNVLQWCMYYPGVLNTSELRFGDSERAKLAGVIAAYDQGDIPGALACWPAKHEPESDGACQFRAMLWLAVGEVERSRTILARVTKSAPGRMALEEMIDAVNFNERAVSIQPATSSEWLARSYYEQSRSDRDGALTRALGAARHALELAPDFGYAAIRVAELEFSFGRTKAATGMLTRGLSRSPRNAQGHALMGFLMSDRNCMVAAARSFNQSIDLDSALGNGWLGRGLCLIRAGRTVEGRRDLQTALVLEPNRAMLHSYFGKASAQAGFTKEGLLDLDHAKTIDPHDPTPWLYSALVRQEQNRLNPAIGDLERSVYLNDNRRLYRSSMLLDQDRAVRGANLARLYQDSGMREIAVREAIRAVETDYSNASAHLFLANAYDALRDPRRIELREETPWFNELLLSNLLGPVGSGNLSQYVSQQEYSRLLESDGLGGSQYTELRTSSEVRSTTSVYGTYGRVGFGLDVSYFDDDGYRLNSDASRTEVYGQFKWQVTPDDMFYFLGKWQDQESGDNFETYDNQPESAGLRFSEQQEPGLLLAGWNHRWAPGSNTLLLCGALSAEQKLTDPASNQFLLLRDPSGLRPGFVRPNSLGFDEYSDPRLRNAAVPPVGLAPDGETLIYSRDLLRAIDPYVGTGRVIQAQTGQFDFSTRRQFDLQTAEIQHIFQGERNTLLGGARWQTGEFQTDTRLIVHRPDYVGGFPTPAANQQVESELERGSLYLYDYWTPWSPLTLMGGVTWDRVDHPDNFRNPPVNDRQRTDEALSGKVGFSYSAGNGVHVRGAYAEGLGGVTFDESVRLEPSQIAGFNQAYRTVLSESIAGSVEAPAFKIWGLGLDGQFSTRTWWSLTGQVIEQDVDRTVGAFSGYELSVFPRPAYFEDDTPQRLAYREGSFGINLNQLIGEEFAAGIGYLGTRSDLRSTYPELVNLSDLADTSDSATLHELSLYGLWNSPTGLFARVEANWFQQRLDDDPSRVTISSPARQGDDFWQFNALAGWRFWRNRGEITVGVLNIADTDYHLSPLNPYGEIVHGRTGFMSCRFSF